MCFRYSNTVQALSRAEHGWHFGAMHMELDQIRDFQIEDMASTMQATAPELWSLIQALLGAGTVAVGSQVETGSEQDLPLPASASRVEVESDSDGEYWELEEEIGMAEHSAQGASSGGNNQAGTKTSEIPKLSDGTQTPGSRKKRQHRVLHKMFARIKTVVILSILLQSRDSHCNALQSVVGVFLHSCNAPEKVVKVLSRMGIFISLSSIHRAVRSLSNRSCQDIQLLGRSLRNTYTFDNFDILLKVLIHTIDNVNGGLVHLTSGTLLSLNHATREDLRCSDFVWNRSELNPHASDPKPFIPHSTMQRIYKLYPEPDGDEDDLGRSGRFRA
ncbi:hypothetical protein LXA43DRAFT_1102606 [Ganoderma leucocontextum]|nr:hypothetical protein LXA43DRAFT_1102606 [Ganoderma leucocontextum]